MPFIDVFNRRPIGVRMSIAVVIASIGGLVAKTIGVPLPWLLGALAGSSALALLGMNLGIPTSFRRAGQLIAGFSIGLHFTAEVAAHIAGLWGWMIATGILSILCSIVIAGLLSRLTGCGGRTAYFASLPGGVAEMAGMADRFGADVTLVSLCQALRVVVIVVTIPPLIVLFSDAAGTGLGVAKEELSWGLMAVGIAASVVVSAGLQRLNVMNSWFLGGILVGSLFGLAQAQETVAPSAVPSLAQLLIGASLGTRFDPTSLRATGWRFLPTTIAMTLILMAFNAGIAVLLGTRLNLSMGILATAPGGIAEMSLTAELLHLSPPLITAWHLVRILLIALLTAPLFLLGKKTWERFR